MDRRKFVQGAFLQGTLLQSTFLQTMGGPSMLSAMAASPAAPGSDRKTRVYRLSFYYMRQGDQGPRMNEFLSSQLPVFRKAIPGPIGFFTVFLGPQIPAMVILAGYPSLAEMEAATARLQTDSSFAKAHTTWEKGSEPPYDWADSVLLAAKDFSPEIAPLAEKPKVSRIFELRVYHSPTLWQSRALDERFAGPEVSIFHRVGIHPILYSGTLVGPNMPNLTYLTPFATLADREKAWDAFAADPEWIKVRKESIDRAGQISSRISITLLRPTDYSPIQ
jgi:hypothetical protein